MQIKESDKRIKKKKKGKREVKKKWRKKAREKQKLKTNEEVEGKKGTKRGFKIFSVNVKRFVSANDIHSLEAFYLLK